MSAKSKVLVTGASGFLGRRTVEMLVAEGFPVRALVRNSSSTDLLRLSGAELCPGDLTDVESLTSAFNGIDYVVHAAADTSSTEEGARLVTIQGTRNILQLSTASQVKRLVYISSCSVYGIVGCSQDRITEDTPLEPCPDKRGLYSWAKLEAEKTVSDFMRRQEVSVVCLRPGTIYGPGGDIYTPMLGFSLGNSIFAVIGDGNQVLPLVYIDNLVEAIITSLKSQKGGGKIYNVVDPRQINKKLYMEQLIRKLYPKAKCFYIPYHLLSQVVAIQERLCRIFKHKPFLTRYRLTSSQKPIIYDCSRIINDMGWEPHVKPEEAFERIFRYEKQHNS